jgi:competence protein ComEC
VIDRFDLWREGAHAIWIDEAGIVRVETVASMRGVRPWVQQPKRRTRKAPKK